MTNLLSSIGWILGRFYIEKAFPIETEQFGDSIALNIKDEYLSRLGTAAWMSRKARKVAAEKGALSTSRHCFGLIAKTLS